MTNSKWFGNSDADPIGDLMRRLAQVESYANDLERKLGNFDSPQPLSRVDPVSYLNPFEGQRAIDPSDEQHMWYSNGEWRKAGKPVLFIKVFSDTQTVATGDGKFIFEISRDMDGLNLTEIETYVSTVSSSGKPTVQIRNITQTADMLTTKCEIDSGEKNSKDAATQPVIDTGNDDVAWGDHLAIDVDVAGTGAKGLGVILTFGIPT